MLWGLDLRPNGDRYRAFGLNVKSSFHLPELVGGGCGAHDIEVVRDEVPTKLASASDTGLRFQVARGRVLLLIDGVGRYLVEGGSRIAVQPAEGARGEDVRLFLLGSAFGAALHQRNDLVLHGSAIAVGGEGVLFLGESGAGKSTLAAAFGRRGYSILTDDLCVVRADASGECVVQPGYPQMKLWRDSLDELGVSATDLRRVREGVDKRAIPVDGSYADRALPVCRVYILGTTNRDAIDIAPLSGAQKFLAIKRQTYRFRFVEGLAAKGQHFEHAMSFASQVCVRAVTRPQAPFRLNALVDRIESELRP